MPRDAPTDDTTTPDTPLTPRHEAFCQYFVLGGNAAYAAQDAGYAPKSSKNQGYRLMRRARIRARVAEIRSELAGTFALDARVLLGKLEALYLRAIEDHHFHAGVRAVEAQARIAGYVRGRAAPPTLSGGEDTPAAPKKPTNDDFPAPVPDGTHAKSMGCEVPGGQK